MQTVFKKILKLIAHLLRTMGVNPRGLMSLRYYPVYRRHLKEFLRLGGTITHRFVKLSDFNAEAGTANGHYFHQDLLVAQFIHQRNPVRHIDIGSRIDGFVAHVASFRPIEVVDVRDLESIGHQNIIFTKGDLMSEANTHIEITDSISCLHVLEHLGLGRYGDNLDPVGHIRGFNNLIKMVKPNGILYVSFPIAGSNQVHFNAHRSFHPTDIFNWPNDKEAVRLERFDLVDDTGNLHQNVDLARDRIEVSYGCGIYTFRKL